MELTEQLLKDALQYGKCFTRNGNTAEYIPELRRVNKYQLGIAAVDMDGNMMEAGDTQTPFTIQSISKIISIIMAIEDKGANYLFNDKVGVEPTGDPFNSIVKLETQERPFNPFINAGAFVPPVRTMKSLSLEERWYPVLGPATVRPGYRSPDRKSVV